MDRRRLLAGLLSLPLVADAARPAFAVNAIRQARAGAAPDRIALVRSGATASRYAGEVIENLDILSLTGDAITITHPGVIVRNCRIAHAGGHGIRAVGAKEVRLESLDVEHRGAGASGEGANMERNNIALEGCPEAVVTRIKAAKGAANIYLENCERSTLSWLELHDARGPVPRGQNVQLNKCANATLEDFSAENGSTSWTEDNVSIFHSDGCVIRRGLVAYNNSPSGVGVMLEGSADCLVEDVDAQMQGNGAFAAVPSDQRESGGCIFRRCRTAYSYNAPRDGRDAPTSNGLSFYMRISSGRPPHAIIDCSYFALANPRNLVWQTQALAQEAGLYAREFKPRPALRLAFEWNA
jgi:hypothetical protein